MTEYYVDDEDNTSEDGNYIVESNAPEVLKGIFYFLKEYEIHFKNDRNGYHGSPHNSHLAVIWKKVFESLLNELNL